MDSKGTNWQAQDMKTKHPRKKLMPMDKPFDAAFEIYAAEMDLLEGRITRSQWLKREAQIERMERKLKARC